MAFRETHMLAVLHRVMYALLMFLAAQSTALSADQRWTLVSIDKYKRILIDATSIEQVGEQVQFAQRLEFFAPTTCGHVVSPRGFTCYASESQIVLDCRSPSSTATILTASFFDDEGRTVGNPLYDYRQRSIGFIYDEGARENIFPYVCGTIYTRVRLTRFAKALAVAAAVPLPLVVLVALACSLSLRSAARSQRHGPPRFGQFFSRVFLISIAILLIPIVFSALQVPSFFLMVILSFFYAPVAAVFNQDWFLTETVIMPLGVKGLAATALTYLLPTLIYAVVVAWLLSRRWTRKV